MRTRYRYLALVLLFVLTWSSAFPAAKIAIGVCPPELFLGLRFLLAATVLLGVGAITGGLRDVPWGRLFLLGLLNQAGYNGLAWVGMKSVSAGLATIVTSLNPILVAVLAAPLLGERLTRGKMAGLLLGLGGAAFIVRDHLALGASPGAVLALFGGLASMVAGTLAFKRLAPATSLPIAVGAQQASAGLALLVVGALTENPAAIRPGLTFILVMVWFVAVVSVGAFLLWFYLLRRGSASSASALHFLMPPTGLVMSWLVLGETLHLFDLLGVVPIGAGIWLATRPGGERPAPERSLSTPALAAPGPPRAQPESAGRSRARWCGG